MIRKFPASVLVLVLVGLASCTSTPPAVRPSGKATHATPAPEQGRHRPISGRPLGPSGIRLVVSTFGKADPAPAVMDVDTSTLTPIVGLPAPNPDPKVAVTPYVRGRQAFVGVSGAKLNQEWVYLLKGSQAQKLSSGWSAFPAFDGSGFWVTDQPVYDGPCTVRKLTENGKLLRRPRWTYCGALPTSDTRYGLHTVHQRRSLLLAHDSLRKLAQYPRIMASTSRKLLVQQQDKDFALVDPGTGKKQPINRPTRSGEAWNGEVSTDGKHIAVLFLEHNVSVYEYLDVWVLDTETLRWTRLPSMPTPADLKTHRMLWTQDGRLVLAGAFVTTQNAYPLESDLAGMIAVWRPGEPTLSVKRLPVPWATHLEILP
ncbi:hypothetical protein [Nonomuraea rhizosphaerae]|uniref:hypothetical protein n=1 Tax=Nonomuraea rhizosphaerae TaxID=2665663 RepID=UPI001C5D5FAB|nr:hypothetical protein [Nonomuraea rhizosphaerae]